MGRPPRSRLGSAGFGALAVAAGVAACLLEVDESKIHRGEPDRAEAAASTDGPIPAETGADATTDARFCATSDALLCEDFDGLEAERTARWMTTANDAGIDVVEGGRSSPFALGVDFDDGPTDGGRYSSAFLASKNAVSIERGIVIVDVWLRVDVTLPPGAFTGLVGILATGDALEGVVFGVMGSHASLRIVDRTIDASSGFVDGGEIGTGFRHVVVTQDFALGRASVAIDDVTRIDKTPSHVRAAFQTSALITVGASELEPPGAMSVRFDDLRVYAP